MDQQTAFGTDAYVAGRRAGLGALSPSLNPFDVGSLEFLHWQQGHQSGTDSVADYANQKARKEWWEGNAAFDLGPSGARLRAGS